MSRWADPPVWVTMALIALFAYAYLHNPGDEAMKGALIAAFAAAYGYWIGSNQQNQKATENTGDAFKAIAATAHARDTDAPSGKPGDPVHTVEDRP